MHRGTAQNTAALNPFITELHSVAAFYCLLISMDSEAKAHPNTSPHSKEQKCSKSAFQMWIGIEGNSRKVNLSLSVERWVLLVLLHQSRWLTLQEEAILCSITAAVPENVAVLMAPSTLGALSHLLALLPEEH